MATCNEFRCLSTLDAGTYLFTVAFLLQLDLPRHAASITDWLVSEWQVASIV